MGSAQSSSSSPSPNSLPSMSSSQSSPKTPQTPLASSSPPSPQLVLTPQPQSTPPTPQLQSVRLKESMATNFQFNEKELSSYDIPKTEDLNDLSEIARRFVSFQYNYIDYCTNRERFIKENSNIDTKMRCNISILIIVGSSLIEKRSANSEYVYQKNAEDLSSALFIRHLFHFAFGIPKDQIMITSTQNGDFYSKSEEDLIPSSNIIFKEIDDIDPIPQKGDYYFSSSCEYEFLLQQNINVTQIGDQQYKFYMTEKLSGIIEPFNYNIIKNLSTNQDSDLLIFFLDHGYSGEFGESIPYQFFIERLIKIKCKHFYVFNDCCCSGSLLNLINYCNSFIDIFPNITDPTLESALFYFLTNLNKVYPNAVQEAVNSKLDLIDSYEISNAIKDEMKSILTNIKEPMLNLISNFVLNYDPEFKKFGCVPHHFIQFSKKATIFSSSFYNKNSFTLPGRALHTTFFNRPKIRVFGSIFTSIFIESLLNEKGQSSLANFCECVRSLLDSYKEKYEKIIISQNKYIKDIAVNLSLPSSEQIISFFSVDPCNKMLFFKSNNDWPDFKSIIIKNKLFWNMDQSEVNPDEYKQVYFCVFKKHDINPPIKNPNNFGPEKKSYYMDKFMRDFEFAVEKLMESNHCDVVFSIEKLNSEDKFIERNNDGYGEFIGLIRPMMTTLNWNAIQLLKKPMTIFFNEHSNDFEKYANIFAEAFKNIMPFWTEIDL